LIFIERQVFNYNRGAKSCSWRSIVLQSSAATLIKHNRTSYFRSSGALDNYRWMCWIRVRSQLCRFDL